MEVQVDKESNGKVGVEVVVLEVVVQVVVPLVVRWWAGGW